LLRELAGRLKEESPAAYRPIETVVDPMVDAGLVSRVAKIRPVLTVKA
jgi:tRNA-splicing ligase RtcB